MCEHYSVTRNEYGDATVRANVAGDILEVYEASGNIAGLVGHLEEGETLQLSISLSKCDNWIFEPTREG